MAAICLMGAAVCASGRVSAKEYCPGNVQGVHAFSGANAGFYSVVLGADGPRTLNATLTAETPEGWYRIAVPPVVLSEHVDNFETPTATFSRSEFASTPFFVQLPSNAGPVRRLYASSAGAQNDGDFGWQAKGAVECAPPEGAVLRTPTAMMHRFDPTNPAYDLTKLPDAASITLKAVPAPAPPMDCAVPFLRSIGDQTPHSGLAARVAPYRTD